MAGKPGGNSPKPPGGAKPGAGKKPPLDKAAVKAWIKSKVLEEVDSLKREKSLEMLYMNRALGVGEMKTFTEEFETAYKKSSNAALKQGKNDKDSVYGNPYEARPKLRKISQEKAAKTTKPQKKSKK